MMKIRSGFTLIELLVVIAIIAILAAILFPVFARAREKARQTTCLSNQKQIGLGFSQYSQDFDENYPICSSDNGNSWDAQILPYASLQNNVASGYNTQIFKCPDDNYDRGTRAARSYAMPLTRADNEATTNTIYGVVSSIQITDSLGFHYNPCFPISKITSVATTILLVESPWGKPSGTSGGNQYARWTGAFVRSASNSTCTSASWGGTGCGQDMANIGNPLHSGGWNYLFCDGHAKWLRPEQTMGKSGTVISPQGYWTITPNT